MTVHIIAETCSNIISHLDELPSIVKRVADTGATSLKVQLFHHLHFPESEWEQKRAIEFPRHRFAELVRMCHDVGLQCGASVFDEEAVDVVVNAGGDFLKLATREFENIGLIGYCYASSLRVIRSYDCTKYNSVIGFHRQGFVEMACVPQYPATNFRMPKSLAGQGWSSHTFHSNDVLMAVTKGATHIEKHFLFGDNDPEIRWSLSDKYFKYMVDDIRYAESVL